MDCLICNNVTFDGQSLLDQNMTTTFCQLLDIQVTTFAWVFNSTISCPVCYAKLKEIQGLFNQLEVIKVRLYHCRKEIIEDLVKSQEATEAAGNQLEERTKIIQEIRSKAYEKPNYDESLSNVKSEDLNEQNSAQNFFESDIFDNFDDFDDGPDPDAGPDLIIGPPPITIKDAQIILEKIQLPIKSSKNAYNITQEPIASFIERDQLQFNLQTPLTSKSPKTKRTRNKKSIGRFGHIKKRQGRGRKINHSRDYEYVVDDDDDSDDEEKRQRTSTKQKHKYNPLTYNKNKKKYICSDTNCGQGFNGLSALNDHQRTHTGERPFQCDICSKCFTSKSILRSHKFRHSIGDSSVQCTICGKLMAKSYLKYHMERHELNKNLIGKEKPFLCDVCGSGFNFKYNLELHRLRKHLNHKENCPHCDQVFSRKFILKEHILREHEKKLDVPCPECNKFFVNKRTMQRHRRKVHLRILKENYQCDFCPKLFKHNLNLKYHIRSCHTMDLPFKCSFDGCKSRGFVTQGKLDLHSRLHSGINYICPYCANGYAIKSSLEIHIKNSCKSKLDSDSLRNFKCTFAGCNSRGFMNQGKLNRHLKLHSGILNYICPYCSKGYAVKSSLKHHIQKSCPNKPDNNDIDSLDLDFAFKCSFDGCQSRGFATQERLKKHIQLHSGINHICPYCAKSYALKYFLKHHIKNSCKKKPDNNDINSLDLDFPFKCTFDGCKSPGFVTQGKLTRHLKLHSGILDHICPYCSKGYAIESHLEVHIKKFCKNKPDDIDSLMHFKCTFDGCKSDGFVTQGKLDKHFKLHHSGIEHICPYCTKRYTNKFSLNIHMKNICKNNPDNM